MTIDELIEQSYSNAVERGFYDEVPRYSQSEPIFNGARLMLMVSELAEALEDIRDGKFKIWYDDEGKPHGLPIELADLAIRLGDYCGWMGIDLQGAIKIKAEYNKTRPYKHGKTM